MSRIKELQKQVHKVLEKLEDGDKRAKATAHLHGVALAAAILAKRRGELCETAAVEQELGEILTDCRNKLLGLGHKLAPRLEGKTTAQISDTIRDEIIGILKELSGDVEKADYRAGET